MNNSIDVSQIYDQNLNFLIGSGASYGLFPTLALNMRDETDSPLTVETLAARFDNEKDVRLAPLFMHYYSTCVRPAETLDWDTALADPVKSEVLHNYKNS